MWFLQLYLFSKRSLENTYCISSWRKEAIQMQALQLYLFSKSKLEETCCISSWKSEPIPMRALQLYFFLETTLNYKCCFSSWTKQTIQMFFNYTNDYPHNCYSLKFKDRLSAITLLRNRFYWKKTTCAVMEENIGMLTK